MTRKTKLNLNYRENKSDTKGLFGTGLVRYGMVLFIHLNKTILKSDEPEKCIS